MENIEAQSKQFNTESSPIKEAYSLLNAQSPKELNKLYTAEDQRLMKLDEWDYKNPDLIINKVKGILENTDENALTEEEKEWRQEILWFWYHHAISSAISKYKDREMAKIFATKAVEIQPENHSNKITKLLFLLLGDKLVEAEELASSIPEAILDDGNPNPEPQTARDLIDYYKKGLI